MTDHAAFPDLAGARVVITGGGSGIGAALVEGFLNQKASVTFLDIAPSDALVDTLARRTGERAHFIACDVSDPGALQEAIADAAERQGGLDVMVNNAANDARIAASDVTPDDWQASLDVNLSPVFFGCQAAAACMESGSAIINFSSITVQMGHEGLVRYVTSKAGIVGMTRALAREWGPRGIRVNAIAPGWVMTEKQEAMYATPEAKAAFLERQCLKQHVQPQHLVAPTLFLASSASAMITSQCLVVDAGVVTG